VTEPMVPAHQFQGPATHCVIRGRALGWLSCTAYSMAMLIDRATLGAKKPTGCDVRANTSPLDITGGLTLPQCAAVAEREYGVDIEVRIGSNVCTPAYAAAKLRNGHPVLLQGNAGAMLGTPQRTTAGFVNHAILLNDGRGWKSDGTPSEVRVFDPAAGGQATSWGRAPKGPQWWPWSLVLKFGALLRPWGDGDSRVLGSGRWYAGIGPDTEPHFHRAFRSIGVGPPMPERFLSTAPTGRRVNVRSGPGTNHPVMFTIPSRHLVLAYQYTPSGENLEGNSRWFGDHSGTLWVHASGLRPE
jgi:hypothetical protein